MKPEFKRLSFANCWNREDFSLQAAPFVSPPKWHLAHTTWFFEEMVLKPFLKAYKTYDDTYAFLFNSYYNSLGERISRHERGLITRPASAVILKYRSHVDKFMERLLESPASPELETLLILGINHEQQHQELLITDLKYSLSHNPTYPKLSDLNLISDRDAENTQGDDWISISEGVYTIGHQGDGFAFDNEFGVHRTFLESFEISKALVTNGEYLKFIEAAAYHDPKYWLDDGWSWINNNTMTKPLYWKKINGDWFQYTISGLMPLDEKAILSHVSFYEAQAFAFWSRTPTTYRI
ncbi:SUMF1/EgtB/PvdO family nonheme iron enzyme [Lacinutrix neustonica]|uniref:SUMF1/EgtB/PvdO family nonheme iron enzyme n=1 Tax=Lacinutrix neustonica TaxID=2980107 RepID=UPI0028BE7292|nr:SUMF1/EgtB/PvdO family nonheme iron enzyme [Lacinutrix neustonica]